MNELVYKYFKEISKIPRGTYNITKISNYLVNCATSRELEVDQDEVGNVIIKKSASEGYEDHEVLILQTHMDMVCVKDKNSNHDFTEDEIEIIHNYKQIFFDIINAESINEAQEKRNQLFYLESNTPKVIRDLASKLMIPEFKKITNHLNDAKRIRWNRRCVLGWV